MRTIYNVIVALSFVQLPVLLFLWSLGTIRSGIVIRISTKTVDLDAFHYNRSNTDSVHRSTLLTPTFECKPYVVTRNKEFILLYGIGACFSAMYIMLCRYNEESGEDKLETTDDYNISSLGKSDRDKQAILLILISRIFFWCYHYLFHFVFLCIVLGSKYAFNQGIYVLDESLEIYAVLMTISTCLFCNTYSAIKRNKTFLIMALLFFVLIRYYILQKSISYFKTDRMHSDVPSSNSSMDVYNSHNTERNHQFDYSYIWMKSLSLCIVQLLIESILVIGHLGDTETTCMTTLHCRLFYICICSCLSHGFSDYF
jgi:hypothetical protein